MRARLLFAIAVFLALGAGLWLQERLQNRLDFPEIPPVPATPNTALELPQTGTRELVGTVQTFDGQPAADAVVLFRGQPSSSWTLTDAHGQFLLQGLPPGSLTLDLLYEGVPPTGASVAALGNPDRLEPPRSVVLTLREPFAAIPDVVLNERSTLAGQLTNGGFSSNLSLNPKLEGYEVLLEPESALEAYDGCLPRRASSDSAGIFRFEDLAHGSYRVILLPNWARGSSWPNLAPADLRIEHPQAQALDLEAQSGELLGVVRDDQSRPVEGALLLLNQVDDPNLMFPPVATDAAGRYSFPEVPAGTYSLELSAGDAQVRLAAFAVRAGQRNTQDLGPISLREE